MIQALKRRRWQALSASVPDSGGLIHGCYKTEKGVLHVIDPSAANKDQSSCKNDESALDWNQQGVQGPHGPQGPQGPQGVQGPQGPSGVSGYEVVSDDSNVPDGTRQFDIVHCPTGKKVVGGGFSTDDFRDLTIMMSGPTANGSGWIFDVISHGPGNTMGHFRAICVSTG